MNKTTRNFSSLNGTSSSKRFLPLFLLAILSFQMTSAQTSKQVIGWFPYMDGGFEAQVNGEATGINPAGGDTYEAWTANAAGVATLQSTTSRTGAMSINFAPTVSTRRIHTPTAILPAQQADVATAYTIQYYYKTAGATSNTDMQAGLSTVGVADVTYTTKAPLTGTNGVWSKYSTSFTTKSGTTPNSPVGIVRSGISVAAPMDIDDFVIYLGGLDTTAPTAASASTVTPASSTSMNISWIGTEKAGDAGGYVIFRSTSSNEVTLNTNGIYAVGNTSATGEGIVIAITLGITGANQYIDTDLNSGTTYYYSIFAVDKAFNYASADKSSASTPTLGINAVSFSANDLKVSKNNGTLNVSTDKTIINNVKVYNIQGKLVAEKKNANASTLNINDLREKNQVLIVKVTLADDTVLTKKVVN